MRRSPVFIGTLLLVACGNAVSPTAALTAKEHGSGVERRVFKDGSRYLVVEALDDDLVHFELAASGAPAPGLPLYTTPMVTKTDYTGPTSFTADADTVETAELRVEIADDLCVTVHDKVRRIILHTLCPKDLESPWKGFSVQSPGTRNVYGLGQYFGSEDPNGDWLGRVWDPLFDGYGARLRGFAGGANNFSVFPVMYALGEANDGYAMFLDQVYKQMWDFRGDPWHVGMWGDQIRWYVMTGPDMKDLRRDYMELTGKPPVPPKRSFGLWVSEFGFGNWDEVKTELADLRRVRMPVDGFALDLQWFGGTFGEPDKSRMGSLTFDDRAFPNPAVEIGKLRDEQGVNLMLIEEPYVSDRLTEHGEMARRGYLARACATCGPAYLDYNPWWGKGGMVDFTNPDGSAFWHDYRREGLISLGITDHWADLGEPEQYLESSWYHGFPELDKHAHADVHNIYGFKWMASIADGYARNGHDERPFLLSRTGTSGIQRYGVGVWSGDIGTNWGNLRSQMQVQMHMSLSGVDYYGSDVGGFQRNADVPGGERLYTQWLAASAALDVPVRPHAWNLDKTRPTSPSRRGDLAANLESVRQRYRLAPYYYSLAHAAHRHGDPVFPPLMHAFQSDPMARRIGYEKMIGPSLLVALAADQSATGLDVYLPAGAWADFHSRTWIASPGEYVGDYPLYALGHLRLPLFARAGAIIPMMTVDDDTLNIRGRRRDGVRRDELTLRVFGGPASSFTLIEDDGETQAYTRGAVAETRIDQNVGASEARVLVSPTTGTFEGMGRARDMIIEMSVMDREILGATLNGAALDTCGRRRGAAPCWSREDGYARVTTGAMAVSETRDVRFTFGTAVRRTAWASFVCRNAPDAGRSAYVVGSDPVLGGWDVARAVRLGAVGDGLWAKAVHGLSPVANVEWKCFTRADDGSGRDEWEPGANNVVVTSASGYAGEAVGGF